MAEEHLPARLRVRIESPSGTPILAGTLSGRPGEQRDDLALKAWDALSALGGLAEEDRRLPAAPVVLASFETPRQGITSPGRIVLRRMREGEWATHWHNLDDGGYHSGHYHRDLAEAQEEYAERVTLWVRRYARVPADGI